MFDSFCLILLVVVVVVLSNAIKGGKIAVLVRKLQIARLAREINLDLDSDLVLRKRKRLELEILPIFGKINSQIDLLLPIITFLNATTTTAIIEQAAENQVS